MRPSILALLAVLIAPVAATGAPGSPATVRIATFNVSMFRQHEGELREDLSDSGDEQAQLAAAILQDARPDIVLLNEFDYDAKGEAARLFRDHYLAVGQDGREPLDYPYLYVPETNTGVPSGQDLDGNAAVDTTPGSRKYGGDAFGFGQFPGQYGFVILSRYPIDYDGIRTFRLLLWKDLPGASIPKDFYSPAALAVLRLSSKNHVDVPVQVGKRVIHVLASHPTPPTFDGPEDRNGARNADEIRFWSLYLGANDDWLSDDLGHRGGLGDASFVILGDLNSDPNDGDSRHAAISELLANPRLQGTAAPTSAGGAEQSRLTGGRNTQHKGDPAQDTADFDDKLVGNLRIDYVLPSLDLPIVASGVFWPVQSDPEFALVGIDPFPVSDHRLVWVDVRLTAPGSATK
jgi:endonuclease/exonuclease/phosphatase family metal-dependent hydrolase